MSSLFSRWYDLFKKIEKPSDKDNYVEYLSRILAVPLVEILLKTSITPNQITIIAACLWFISFILLFLRLGFWFDLLATALFAFSFVLDFCDGAIARLKKQASLFGRYLDAYLDTFRCILLLMIGVYRLYDMSGNLLVLYLGFVAVVLYTSFGSIESSKTMILASLNKKVHTGEMVSGALNLRGTLITHIMRLYNTFDTTLIITALPLIILFQYGTLFPLGILFFSLAIFSKCVRYLLSFSTMWVVVRTHEAVEQKEKR